MRVSHSEGIAIYTGPESCGAVCEGGYEALTGESTGRVFSRVTANLRNADAVKTGGRQHRKRRYREASPSSARSKTPSTYRNILHGNREVLRSPREEDALGRIGKFKDTRR
jgi:hypothetical protein